MRSIELPPVEGYARVEDVLREALGRVSPGETFRAPTSKAYGLVCARDVAAPSDVPDVARSHMDGYALRFADLEGSSGLRVRGDLGPGAGRRGVLGPREAARVATGAPLPDGADTVVPVEMAEEAGGSVRFGQPREKGAFVYPRGEDVRKGETILKAGRAVRAQDVGLLLTLGVGSITAYKRPRVAVLATGSELTNRKATGGRVRNSHSPMFLKLIEALGCVPIDAGIAKDASSELAARIRAALARSDCLITLGGTSVGKRDLVGEAVAKLRPEVGFRGIRMDRGRVAGVAVARGKPVLMMPGPAQGAMNAFVLFGIPLLGALGGKDAEMPRLRCSLGSPWKARKRFADFVKVIYVSLEDGGRVARPMSAETESMALLAKADAVLIVPEGVTSLEEGASVEVHLLPGFSFV